MRTPITLPTIIPAYQPGPDLVDVVEGLIDRGWQHIVVVNDGSDSSCDVYFARAAAYPQVHIVRHAINLGKGAALRSGLNHALLSFPDATGYVTADADGQHHPDDIASVSARLAESPGSLVLGVRRFEHGVPLRSRVGNEVTRGLLRVILGQKIADTQTGLRGIPRELVPHLLRLRTSGYEFELDMLIACKHQSIPILEQTIRVIYIDGNKSSHFHPVFDSMRIYFVLFRFTILSLLTALLDNTIFAVAFTATASIWESQVVARVVAMLFNYAGARTIVFHSRQRHTIVVPKYVALVCANALLSYACIHFMVIQFDVHAIYAKILAECILFAANFAIQRDFVFTGRTKTGAVTDWDSYYKGVPATARLTRAYTSSVLIDAIRKHCRPAAGSALTVTEFGGANSCFLERILYDVKPRLYQVVDNNHYGLSLLQERARQSGAALRLCEQDVLNLSLDGNTDLVFSVGLIEHFQQEDTRRAVVAHLDAVRPGGVVIITFPTPTLLYRITRNVLEAFGLWKFPDERPLRPQEVLSVLVGHADVLTHRTLWPLVLTQHLIVARKRPMGASPTG